MRNENIKDINRERMRLQNKQINGMKKANE